MALPHARRHLISNHFATVVCCAIAAIVFASPRPAARADAAKDAQQDEHMVAIDARLNQRDKDREIAISKRDAEIALLNQNIEEERKQNAILANQVANDEGKAQGAFILIGLLSASGVFVSFKARKQ